MIKKSLKLFVVTFLVCFNIFLLIFLLASFAKLEWVNWDWGGVRIILNICFVISLIPPLSSIVIWLDNNIKSKSK